MFSWLGAVMFVHLCGVLYVTSSHALAWCNPLPTCFGEQRLTCCLLQAHGVSSRTTLIRYLMVQGMPFLGARHIWHSSVPPSDATARPQAPLPTSVQVNASLARYTIYTGISCQDIDGIDWGKHVFHRFPIDTRLAAKPLLRTESVGFSATK